VIGILSSKNYFKFSGPKVCQIYNTFSLTVYVFLFNLFILFTSYAAHSTQAAKSFPENSGYSLNNCIGGWAITGGYDMMFDLVNWSFLANLLIVSLF
jgi:hypothetical protein